MSRQIDQYAVEMRFDNQHFEKNVQTSLSTLDKLKQSLNLTGASKGLESINNAAKNNNIGVLGGAVETVSAKFSALQVMGVTALANITNSAVNAGKRIVSSLTIDPVKSGFNEYELKMGSIQTIMASTGESLEVVNGYLNELNEYSDKTIYSFSDMTQNIGKFTNAGVKLEDAVMAIKGISNEAAVSGANANEASRAMYNFAQALSAGYVKLIDWKSIENANMATVEFKQQLIDTAVECGTLTKQADGMYKVLTENNMGSTMDQTISATKNFNDSLNYQWMTTEVLVGTLGKYADETTDIGKKATQAATEVKTFTQMMDSLKESAQSGWAQTWEIVFGDFNEGKALWTSIYEVVGGIIDKMSDMRNAFLKSALGKTFTGLSDAVNRILDPVSKVSESIEKVTTSTKTLGEVVDKVLGGSFGDGQERYDKLTKAGLNYYEVQNKINEALGSSVRHSEEKIKAQDKLLGSQEKTTEATSDTAKETKKLTEEQKKQLKRLVSLNEESEEYKKLTKDQVAAIKELRKVSEKLGLPIEELIDNLDELNGRWILLNSFKNIGEAIAKVFKSIGDAWRDTFNMSNMDARLFDALTAFHKFTEQLIVTDETAEKLTTIFKALFDVLDIVATFASGTFGLAFRVVKGVIGALDTTVLDLVTGIAKLISKFHDFVFENKFITGAFDAIANVIETVIESITNFFKSITEHPEVQEFLEGIKEMWSGLFGDADTSEATGALDKFKESLTLSEKAAENFSTIMEGLWSGFKLGGTVAGRSVNAFLKIFDSFLGLFSIDLVDAAVFIAEKITALNNWIEENTLFGWDTAYGDIAGVAKAIYDGVTSIVDAFLKLESVQKIIQNFKDLFLDIFNNESLIGAFSLEGVTENIKAVFEKIRTWVESLSDSEQLGVDIATGIAKGIGFAAGFIVRSILDIGNVILDTFATLFNIDLTDEGENIVVGLINGIVSGIGKIAQTAIDMATTLVQTFCDYMGIESPSKRMYEYGTNIIEGLVNGIQAVIGLVDTAIRGVGKFIVGIFEKLNIKQYFTGLFDAIKFVYTNIVAIIKELDFKKLLAIVPVAVVLLLVKKLYDMVTILTDGITNVNKVLDNFATIEKSFAKMLDSFTLDIKSKAIKRMAESIAILVGALIALTFVDQKKLLTSTFAIVALAGILIGLSFAMDKLNTASAKWEKGKGINFDGLKTGLLSLGAAILLMAVSAKILGTIDHDQFINSLKGMALVIGAMAAVFIAFGAASKWLDTSGIDKLGGMLVKLSIAMMLMVGVCKLVGTLDPGAMKKGAAFAGAFLVFAGVLIAVSHFSGEHANKIGGMVLKLSIAMALMVGVCKLVGMLETGEMLKGAAFAAGFVVFVGALVKITRVAPDTEIQKIGGLVLAISVSLLLMVGMCKLVGMLSLKEMVLGAVFAAAFVKFVKVLVQSTTIASDAKIAKVAGTIFAFSVAIGVLAGVCVLLGMLNLEMLVKGVSAVVIFGTMITLLVKVTKGATDVKGTVMAMAVAIGVMAASVAILSFIPWQRLAPAVVGMGLLIGIFGLAAKAASTFQASVVALGIMVGAIALLSFALYHIAKLDVESVLGASLGLSIVMTAFANALRIISSTLPLSLKAVVSIAVMLAVTWALSELIKKMATMEGIENALTAAQSLSTVLLAFSAATAICALAGLGGPAALIGIGSMMAMIIAVGGLMAAIGALATEYPKLEEFLNKAIPLLEQIGVGLGSFFGGIIQGFSDAVISIIPMMGLALGTFATHITPFIAVAKTIDDSVLKGIGYLSLAIAAITASTILAGISSFLSMGTSFVMLGLQLSAFIFAARPFLMAIQDIDPTSIEAANTLAQMIMTLTSASLINSIASFFGMGVDFSVFGTQLTAFGDAIVAFSKQVSGNIDPAAVEAAASAGMLMAELQKSLPRTGGWVQEIAGEQDLAKFGAACLSFGQSISKFCASVSGENTIDPAAAEAAASAGNIMAELQNALPRTGGWLQDIAGEQDLAAFGASCVAFAGAITDFSKTVGGENAIDTDAAQKAADAGMVMAELQKALPKTGGWLQDIAGEKDLTAFGNSCVAFGKAISDFSDNVKVDEDAVTAAANAGKVMAEVQKAIPEDKWFDGKMSLDDFGKKIKKFGESIAKYSDKVADIDASAINTSTTAAKKLVNVAKNVGDIDGDKIDDFSKVKTIGKAIKSYSDKVSGIDTSAVSSSISAANRLKNFINSLASIDTSGVSSFKSAVNSLAKTNVNAIVKSFSDSSSKLMSSGAKLIESLVKGMKSRQSAVTTMGVTVVTTMYKALTSKMSAFMSVGTALMSKLASGMNRGRSKVTSAAKSPMVTALTAIKSYYTSFYNAGSYLVTGFANGISANSYRAAAKARAMAKAAKQAAEKALGIQSPSKEFYKIGAYVGQGFINALGDYEGKVYSASSTMADSARSGMSNAISKIIDAFDADMDTQPTIRPVVDLSDVRSGVGAINGMFGDGRTLRVATNIGTVSSMMAGYNQNGNDDVVSAIDKLRKAMGNTGGDVYNINGITYDNGSELSKAMDTIVRAARIERRR